MTGSGSAGVKRKNPIEAEAAGGPPTSLRSEPEHLKQVMNSARCEILELRHRNEILAAKADTLEIFAVAFRMRDGQQGMCPDVAWELQRTIDSLE